MSKTPPSDQDVCQVQCLHHEVVEKARSGLAGQETIELVSRLFKMLGDPTRLSIIQALSLHELCVCDLASLLSMSQSAVSHQLRLLRTARLVRFRKQGKVVFYSLDDEHVEQLLAQALALAHEGRE